MYIHTHLHIYIYIYVYIYKYINIFIYTYHTYTYTHIVHSCTSNTPFPLVLALLPPQCALICRSPSLLLCTLMSTFACMCLCVHIWLYT